MISTNFSDKVLLELVGWICYSVEMSGLDGALGGWTLTFWNTCSLIGEGLYAAESIGILLRKPLSVYV